MKLAIIICTCLLILSYIAKKCIESYISDTPEELVKFKYNVTTNTQIFLGLSVLVMWLALIADVVLTLIYIL